jgi:hypothetical protein
MIRAKKLRPELFFSLTPGNFGLKLLVRFIRELIESVLVRKGRGSAYFLDSAPERGTVGSG